MKISFKNIPKFQGGGSPLFKGLTLNPNRNNIYFKGDWNNYNNWHSKNIVLPWLNQMQDFDRETDWESLITNTLDSWNNAGGFQWLNANPEQRQHGMQSPGTKTHQELYYNNPILRQQDNIIGQNTSSYSIPINANSADHFENGVRIGRNNIHSDNDFGIQTGNRRPTIHINTDEATTQQWDDYFRKLGYIGKYKYLDHWVPTKDIKRATVQFGPAKIAQEVAPLNLDGRIKPLNFKFKVKTQHEKYGIDWSKIREAAQRVFSDPNLYAMGRLAGNLINNERVYNEQLKGINPVLRQSYNTYRQVVGDEATKQAYYRRATQGESRSAQPFTSDADRQVAYMQEARRVGDELRAQGDLADNQRIRETSEQASQHADANRQRATEVANANIASINQANALRHNLLAQKHSAQWSSIDNFLQGIEYRKRQQLAEDQELEDKIYLLNQDDYKYTPEYANAYKEYSDVLEKHKRADGTYDLYDPEVVEARGKFKNFVDQKTKEILQNYQNYRRKRNPISFAKHGTKITKKKKDDLLYKSTKDVVEHFRKMSKLSSDAQNRKQSKIEKLTSHPKGTKKYQQGGVAPFTIYKPIALGGELSSTTTTSAKSKGNDKDEALDMVKELFKQLKGLPADVNSVYTEMSNFMARKQAFGDEMTTDDIASMYLTMMKRIQSLNYYQQQHESARKSAANNDALDEFAVDEYGQLIGQNKEGKLVRIKSISEALEKGVNPLTNDQLSHLRATVFPENYNLDEIVSRGVGLTKISQYLKSQIPTIGSSEVTIEGYTKKASNDIKAGLQVLAGAPDGYYKTSDYTKTQQDQAKLAMAYLKSILPKNMKAVIKAHAELGGLTEDQLIASLVGSELSSNERHGVTALTGKAAKDGSNSGKDNLEMNYALKLLTGIGEPRLESFGIGNNNAIKAFGRSSIIADTSVNENAYGADFSYNELYKSGVGRILNLDNASFGNVPINKFMKDSIIVDNSKIVGVDLPYTTDSNGRIIPDFSLLERIEEADTEALKQNLNPDNPDDISKINQIYANKNLPIKYNGVNNLTGNYMRFAVIQATASEDAFLYKEGLSSNKSLTLITDDSEIEKYKRLMSTITNDKKYSLKREGMFNFGNKDVYKGSIFIPITGDITDATLAGGASKLTTGSSTDQEILRDKWNTRNYVAPPEINISK